MLMTTSARQQHGHFSTSITDESVESVKKNFYGQSLDSVMPFKNFFHVLNDVITRVISGNETR